MLKKFFIGRKKENEDEFHKEYGVLSNSVYILKCIKKYKKSLIPLMIIGAFTNSCMQYLWTVIGKFVIDIVSQQASSHDQSIKPLVVLLCITTAIELVAMALNTFTDNKRWYSFIYVRLRVNEERIAKALSMNYETLEDPKMLDRMQKASQATDGNNNGVEGLMQSVYNLMVQMVLIIVTLSVISTLNLWLVFAIILLTVLQYFFFAYTVKKDKKETWDKMAPIWRKINYIEQTTQDFSYSKDIRLFSMKNWLANKQHAILEDKYSHMAKSHNFWIYNSIFSHGISILRNVLIYGVLIYSVLFKDVTIGNFTLYLGTAMTFSNTLTNLLNGMGQFKQRSMEVDDFRSFLEIKNFDEKQEYRPLPKTDSYKFEFKNVSFKYMGQEKYAVKNLNLTLEQGKRLAIVGLNGAGKTTFIKLLLRLYDVTEGEILLNGTDIREFDRVEYYKLFAPVFQNVEIFAFPMCENVSMKSPDETDCEKAEKCLRDAGLGDKVDTLSDGVNTQLLKIIFDNGVDLSGGEKQKLALARALYKNSPVVVLDEPTAALDALAEYKLYKDFDKITKGKSAVYISHRLSSTRFCDAIAMFKAGEMVEYGTHDDLLAQNGEYAKMFEVQAQYYRDKKKEKGENGYA